MRFSRNRKVAAPWDRRDELRKARAAAPTLRKAWPDAALVWVEINFQSSEQLAHAPQTFSIYPPAKAHFSYLCPFGDCNGMYDLNEAALDALRAGKPAAGTLRCTGH